MHIDTHTNLLNIASTGIQDLVRSPEKLDMARIDGANLDGIAHPGRRMVNSAHTDLAGNCPDGNKDLAGRAPDNIVWSLAVDGGLVCALLVS